MPHVLVLGAGVVGLATGRGLLLHGHRVTFVDSADATVRRLSAQGHDACLPSQVDFSSADATMVCVGTPTIDCQPVLDHLLDALSVLARGLRPNARRHLIVVRSTVPPTTAVTVLRPLIERESGLRVGEDVGLCVNPEFLRQASADEDFAHPWLTLLGCPDDVDYRFLVGMYAPFGGEIVRTDWTTAELIKYASNLYNATKISFFNEFHLLCARLGVDSHVLGSTVSLSAEGMWNPRYGTRGGWAYGGACLPKDTRGLIWFAERLGIDMPLLRATVEVNERMQALGGRAPASLHEVAPELVTATGPRDNRVGIPVCGEDEGRPIAVPSTFSAPAGVRDRSR